MSLDDALDRLLAQVEPLPRIESVSTFEADGRVLAADLVAALQVPPQDNASMDGYALKASDVSHVGAVLRVTQRVPAGAAPHALEPGTAARIFTGAQIPEGADTVVMQEETEAVGGDFHAVRFHGVPGVGQWIRRAGEDVTRGTVVLPGGERLSPASLGLAASIGCARLDVVARPRVALFSTGDELVMPGDVLRTTCRFRNMDIVPDRREATVAALKSAADHHDLILTSGGVSVGEEDHIKPAVEQLGALDLWQIAMKPGKPFAHGTVRRDAGAGTDAGRACHFIGLPGNPVSSYITFLLLVRPFLLRLQGAREIALKTIVLPAHFSLRKADKRREFLRVRRNAAGGLDLFTNQSSGVLTSVVWGDGVVDNPAGTTIVQGDLVSFIPFSELLA